MKLAVLKTKLLCLGVESRYVTPDRLLGAGRTCGRTLILSGGSQVYAPVYEQQSNRLSPFSLVKEGGSWTIRSTDGVREAVGVISDPEFYKLKTSDGKPMYKIARLHGKGCLATTLLSYCARWDEGLQCKFCTLGLKGQRVVRKTGRQLVETLGRAMDEMPIKHMTITTGTPPSPNRGVELLASTVNEIKAEVAIPIEVQLEPPSEPRFLDLLAAAGVDSVGMHIDSFDGDIRRKMTPGKSEVAFEEYFRAWEYAVDLFGKGQVNSFIIVGLGEEDRSIINGCEHLARIGVIPYIVPLYPSPESMLKNWPSPHPERLHKIYVAAAEILKRENLDPLRVKAGCVRCGACSSINEYLRA